MEKRPNVFNKNANQTKPDEQKTDWLETPKLSEKNYGGLAIDEEYKQKSMEVAKTEVYTNYQPESKMDIAIEEMKKRTEEQLRLRDESLRKHVDMNKANEKLEEKKSSRPAYLDEPKKYKQEVKSYVSKVDPKNQRDVYIDMISQPQFNAAFDLLPIPSEGKIYKNKKSRFKVAFITAADENILTSPNLLQSGEFLEILINRKLLESDIRYKDLNVGDRNAIMLWLRATCYGEMYPITVLDEDGHPFEHEVDLTTLKTKNLGATPDEEGYFDFVLPLSKKKIKFKLLTVGDAEEIEILLEEEKSEGIPVNNAKTYTLRRQIVDVDGIRHEAYINDFVDTMRSQDATALNKYIEDIESGVDLQFDVPTPRGGSVTTFLPLNFRFFWPNLSI